ncbi:MAG: hypothetical protein NZ740_00615 [Kiritimatiellae bacterium]|nr:hypothetical protein [Kiritimatiellia bacterium]MDW8457592.1 hypothetical protein [Verrucomicrobiota bacterium]
MAKGFQRSEGFSLVETALALLVVSIGLSAVLALLPTAMDQGKRASDETYAAFFADAVFNTYLAAAWSTNVAWSDLPTYRPVAPVTISNPSFGTDVFWKYSTGLVVRADGQIRTQLFVAASTREKWLNDSSPPLPYSWEQYDHALRYRLTMTSPSARRRVLSLEVWPGEYGITNNPYRFVTEVFDHGF